MKKLFSVILLIILLGTNISYSQESKNITVSATVLTRISITSKSDLDFGSGIVPGYDRIVSKTDATSGRIGISGLANKQISIGFVIPTTLSNGVTTMPITFSTTDAAYQIPSGSLTAFNPATITNATFGTAGTMTLFLGGKVKPSLSQQGGLYTGAITVNLQYTGN